MPAKIAKNEVTASKRYIDIEIWQAGALVPAPGGVDFVALGMVYVPSSAAPNDYILGTGTIANKRRALTFTPFVFTASAASDQLTKVAHGLITGDGPVNVAASGGGTLPTGLLSSGNYYVIYIDDDNIKLASSQANAYAGTAIDLTTDGTATLTLSAVSPGCQRGLVSWYRYTFTQGETNIDLSEISVLVDGPGYERHLNGGGYATAILEPGVSDFGDAIIEAGITRAQKERLELRTMCAKGSVVGNDITWRDMADSKDSHSGTVTGAGRIAITIIDAD